MLLGFIIKNNHVYLSKQHYTIMTIERTKDEVIIRLPAYVKTDGLQRLVDLLSYKEAVEKSEATQDYVDKLAKEVKKGWWAKNGKK